MHLLHLLLFISTCWLLHVSAVACHHQGAYWILLSYLKNTTSDMHGMNIKLRWRVFTPRYGLSPYMKQIRLVFKRLTYTETDRS
jgi:hypothetical protein